MIDRKTTMTKLKRIHAGRYEDGTFGIRKVEREWQTFRLSREEDLDGGWMQTYPRLRDARKGLEAVHAEEKAPKTMPDFDEVFGIPGDKIIHGDEAP